MILIDSDILIWILRNNAEYKNKFNTNVELYNGKIFITPIQFVEILAGVKEKEKINTELFLDSLIVIDIDKVIGRLAGQFIRTYGKSHNVHIADAIVASTAKVYDFKLWTNNKKHYPMLTNNEFLK
jgi:predicted nucleic acid-binding protein